MKMRTEKKMARFSVKFYLAFEGWNLNGF